MTSKEPERAGHHDTEALIEPHDLDEEPRGPEDIDSGAWGGDDFGML